MRLRRRLRRYLFFSQDAMITLRALAYAADVYARHDCRFID